MKKNRKVKETGKKLAKKPKTPANKRSLPKGRGKKGYT